MKKCPVCKRIEPIKGEPVDSEKVIDGSKPCGRCEDGAENREVRL